MARLMQTVIYAKHGKIENALAETVILTELLVVLLQQPNQNEYMQLQ